MLGVVSVDGSPDGTAAAAASSVTLTVGLRSDATPVVLLGGADPANPRNTFSVWPPLPPGLGLTSSGLKGGVIGGTPMYGNEEGALYTITVRTDGGASKTSLTIKVQGVLPPVLVGYTTPFILFDGTDGKCKDGSESSDNGNDEDGDDDGDDDLEQVWYTDGKDDDMPWSWMQT